MNFNRNYLRTPGQKSSSGTTKLVGQWVRTTKKKEGTERGQTGTVRREEHRRLKTKSDRVWN